jgi:type III secretory pathway component EscU
VSSEGTPREPDVEISGWARIGSLRFKREPLTQVEFEGESEKASARRNLPDEVRSGTTYRDVEVVWRGGAHVAVGERRPRRDGPSEPRP